MNPLLALSAAALSACVVFWVSRGDQTGRIGEHLAVYAVAFVSYLVSLIASRGLSRAGLRLALGLALGWKLALACAPPLLSDDVFRYVWEGRIQRHGGNPFAWPDRPEAEKWLPLRDPVWGAVNHKDYTAIYPPLWQLAARSVVSAHDSVTAMKLFAVLCEALTMLALLSALELRRLPRERVLIFAWSPLALVEIAGSGHNDALGILLAVGALLLLERGLPMASAVAAGLGFGAKLLPGLIAAAWGGRYRPKHLVAAVVTIAVATAPYLDAGKDLLLSLSRYSHDWRFNETVLALMRPVLGSHLAAVRVGSGLALALALGLALRRAEPVAAGTAVVAAFLLLAPNVLPWYALWLLPFLVLRDEPALLLFTGTVALAYVVYPLWQSGEPWQVPAWLRGLEYGPCLLVGLATHRPRS